MVKKTSAQDEKSDLQMYESLSKLGRGHVLMRWILQECARRKLKFRDLKDILGMSRSYLFSIRYGQRNLDGISREMTKNIARFLNTDSLSIMLASGKLHPEDFYEADESQLVNEVNRAIEFIAGDPKWGATMPEVADLPFATRLFIVRCYEKAEDKILLASRIDVIEALEGHGDRTDVTASELDRLRELAIQAQKRLDSETAKEPVPIPKATAERPTTKAKAAPKKAPAKRSPARKAGGTRTTVKNAEEN